MPGWTACLATVAESDSIVGHSDHEQTYLRRNEQEKTTTEAATAANTVVMARACDIDTSDLPIGGSIRQL